MSLSVADRLLLQDLRGIKERVESLEKCVRTLEAERAVNRKPLAAQAAANKAAGEALYAEVRVIFEQYQGPNRLTGKRVLTQLTRDPKPSVRQIQDLLKRARAELAGRKKRDVASQPPV